jgi:phospholipase/carboxylesterase
LEAQTIEGSALPYVLVKPAGFTPGTGYPLVVLLHGFGANMRDLASLAPSIDGAGYVYAFPNAPYRLPIAPGLVGYSWATNRPGVEPPSAEAPSLDDLLDAFFTDVGQETGAEPGKVVLGGFSQGGGVTLRYGLPRADKFAGLAVLSGAFRDPEELRPRLPPVRTTPIFVAHGRYDQVVDPSVGEATKTFLEELGYSPTFHDYDMAHEITAGEVRDLSAWLHQALPPKQ